VILTQYSHANSVIHYHASRPPGSLVKGFRKLIIADGIARLIPPRGGMRNGQLRSQLSQNLLENPKLVLIAYILAEIKRVRVCSAADESKATK